MYVEENEKSGSLNMVHISIKQTTATKTKKKTARPKGKYKKVISVISIFVYRNTLDKWFFTEATF